MSHISLTELGNVRGRLESGGCGLAGGGALHFGRAYVLDFAAAGNRGVERGGGIAENVAGSTHCGRNLCRRHLAGINVAGS